MFRIGVRFYAFIAGAIYPYKSESSALNENLKYIYRAFVQKNCT